MGLPSVGAHRPDSWSHAAVDNLLTLLTQMRCFLICEMGGCHLPPRPVPPFKEHHSWRCDLCVSEFLPLAFGDPSEMLPGSLHPDTL